MPVFRECSLFEAVRLFLESLNTVALSVSVARIFGKISAFLVFNLVTREFRKSSEKRNSRGIINGNAE